MTDLLKQAKVLQNCVPGQKQVRSAGEDQQVTDSPSAAVLIHLGGSDSEGGSAYLKTSESGDAASAASTITVLSWWKAAELQLTGEEAVFPVALWSCRSLIRHQRAAEGRKRSSRLHPAVQLISVNTHVSLSLN